MKSYFRRIHEVTVQEIENIQDFSKILIFFKNRFTSSSIFSMCLFLIKSFYFLTQNKYQLSLFSVISVFTIIRCWELLKRKIKLVFNADNNFQRFDVTLQILSSFSIQHLI